ncbi:MAG: hypothetical protein ABSD75_15965 [Terriglobales bacterium]|jgi:hypothetical protein
MLGRQATLAGDKIHTPAICLSPGIFRSHGPTTRDVGTITRPIADLLPEQIALTREEYQQLLCGIQMAIITIAADTNVSRIRGKNACKPRSLPFACAAPGRQTDLRVRRRPLQLSMPAEG